MGGSVSSCDRICLIGGDVIEGRVRRWGRVGWKWEQIARIFNVGGRVVRMGYERE